MAIKPEEEPTAAPAKARAARSSRRRSELDLTKRNVGPAWRQYLRAMGPGLGYRGVRRRPVRDRHLPQAGAQYGPGVLVDGAADVAVDGRGPGELMAAVQEICDPTALATRTVGAG